jgi:hypothetical protein
MTWPRIVGLTISVMGAIWLIKSDVAPIGFTTLLTGLQFCS